MQSNSAITRYTTSDFQSAPVLALADLMGLDSGHKQQIASNTGFYGGLLCGIAVHRHLDRQNHMEVNRRIIEEVPVGRLQAKLRELVVMQRVQPYWFMWSLSDEELQGFFELNNAVETVTGHLVPSGLDGILGGLTVAALATTAYEVATSGGKALVKDRVRAVAGSQLVEAVARRLGANPAIVVQAGYIVIPVAIVIAGLNIMAKHSSERARRELSARGLLAYKDL
ncbi:hypothetical protein C7H09_11660 [Marinobacter fuscus]|uniref:Uncharacterized protein n=1 Tax=Marinobacter fuscus TaxID=2109942 RepID=A0A2T1K8Z2_9GAMM|nr:hypothetical protein [Marinobacter fuscus]PSF05992.1 hypothetical protein C7H09_11660 [Marinobacter fuscus]